MGCIMMIKIEKQHFLRYPGGKQRIMGAILPYLPSRDQIKGRFVEPFLGGGSAFFAIQPKRAFLADINPDLIELYQEIKDHPKDVWDIFRRFPSTKEGYYQVRNCNYKQEEVYFRAARTLYLNRTCFKGMWRHNSNGIFNVGYGGQSRRWVISEDSLLEVSERLRVSQLECQDFQKTIESCNKSDFIFLDPPYKPGDRELSNPHYLSNKFSYNENVRLVNALMAAHEQGIEWAMTISSHPDILSLYKKIENVQVIELKRGTGKLPGELITSPGECLICNYKTNVNEVKK